MKPSDFAKSARANRKGACRVLVSLAAGGEKRDAVLKRLTAKGLSIERVIEGTGTIVGSIAPEAIPALESDESVAAVERSETLGPHD